MIDLVHDRGPYKGTTTRAFYQADGNALRYTSLVAPKALSDSKVVASTLAWKRK